MFPVTYKQREIYLNIQLNKVMALMNKLSFASLRLNFSTILLRVSYQRDSVLSLST